MGNYVRDFNFGKEGEDTILKIILEEDLLNSLIIINKPPSTSSFTKYDLAIGFTIECKTERPSENMYFELSKGKKKDFKPSGLIISEADWICYLSDNLFIIFNREELLKDIRRGQEKKKCREIPLCGNKNSGGVLFKKKYIIKNFKSIKTYKYIT